MEQQAQIIEDYTRITLLHLKPKLGFMKNKINHSEAIVLFNSVLSNFFKNPSYPSKGGGMKNITFLLFITILSGCQKFEILEVEVDSNKIVFTKNDIINECSGGVYIFDFGIEYVSESDRVLAWSIARAFDSEYVENLSELPFFYGTAFKGIETRSKAIAIKSGNYNYGGTLACLSSNNEKSISISGSFTIEENKGIIKLIK